MPSAQMIDFNPSPRQEQTPLEKTVAGFTSRARENQLEQTESDALRDIYSQYQQDGQNLERTIMEIQTRPGISPTTRVNTINQLIGFQKHNQELQKQFAAQQREQAAIRNKESSVRGLEKERGLEEGALSAFNDNPALAERISRPEKQEKINQADRPRDPEQQRLIDEVTETEQYKNASPGQREKLLGRKGVSNSNIESTIKSEIEDEKLAKEERRFDQKQAYAFHKDSEKYDELIEKEAKAAKHQLAAIGDVEKSVENVSPTQLSNVFKIFGAPGKMVSDALLSKDQAKIQASIPAFLEGRKELFGIRLSDADLKLLSDKMIDIGKSPEANKEILRLAKKYAGLSMLRSEIGREIKRNNNGLRPLDYSQQVEEQYDERSKALLNAEIDAQAIENVPKGKVLMFDKKRRPLHVPEDEVEKYSNPPYGATLS